MNKKEIIFKFKKSYSISYNKDYFCCVGNSVNLYDTRTGKLIINFKDIEYPNHSKFMGDNGLIVKNGEGKYFVYDLSSNKLINTINPPDGVLGSEMEFFVTSDSRYIIDIAQIDDCSKLMVMNIESGEYTLYDTDNAVSCQVISGKTENEYLLAAVKNKNDEIYSDFCVFAHPMNESGLKSIFTYGTDDSAIDFNGNEIVFGDYSGKVTIIDMNGEVTDSVNFADDDDFSLMEDITHLKWSANGRFIAVVKSESVLIYDTDEKQIVKTFEAEDCNYADFYDNDTKLLIETWNDGYLVDLKI